MKSVLLIFFQIIKLLRNHFQIILQNKIVDFSGIQIWIVNLKADH